MHLWVSRKKLQKLKAETDLAATDEQFNFVRTEEEAQRTLVCYHVEAAMESRELLLNGFVEQKVGIQFDKFLHKTILSKFQQSQKLGMMVNSSAH